MIKNYFKIAWRNLLQSKVYSLLNIGGLAIGMAVAMIIGLWVYDEVSYNHSHQNYEHIGQVYKRFTEPLAQKTSNSNALPQPVAKVLTEKYGHLFKHVVLLWWDMDYTIRIGESNFTKRGQFIEKDAIEMFSLKMLRGSNNSLNEMQSIIVSESASKALFNDKDPINQVVKLNKTFDAIITGVYADIAPNSIFGNIQFFGNYENLRTNTESLKSNETNWGNSSHRIFVQTADNVTLEQAADGISELYEKDAPENFSEQAKKYKTRVGLFPMKDWYLYSEFKDGFPAAGRITFVWLFGAVGAFVLLLACINFMNLTTARNQKRSKEVGIRKAIGSRRSQLVSQFLSESFLVVLLSLVIALILVAISLSSFNTLADKNIRLPITNTYFWLGNVAFLILTSFLSGLYPAFYLSSFQPVKVLKGTLRAGKYAALPRKILVVIQVTVSVVLMIGATLVYQQVRYAQDRPAGYNAQGLIRIPIGDPDFNKIKFAMRDELLASGVASDVAFSGSPLTAVWENWGGFTWKGKNPDAESSFMVTGINEDYGRTIQWKILQGRDFSRKFRTDVDALIINRAAAKYMGLENPVGEFITHDYSQQHRLIVGMVDDVVVASPYEPVHAAFYWLEKDSTNSSLGQMQVKLNASANVTEALSKIESIQKKLAPSAPFSYSFVDEEYGTKFRAEQRIGKLSSVFAVLAIFISCLGLFGLSSFMAEQKTKEIGVRKVVGASLYNIWSLLSREFVALVLISCLLAVPVAYYYLHQWLLTYEYHTQMNPLVFIFSGVGALAITLATVSFHSVKAAIANPVKSLRSE